MISIYENKIKLFFKITGSKFLFDDFYVGMIFDQDTDIFLIQIFPSLIFGSFIQRYLISRIKCNNIASSAKSVG